MTLLDVIFARMGSETGTVLCSEEDRRHLVEQARICSVRTYDLNFWSLISPDPSNPWSLWVTSSTNQYKLRPPISAFVPHIVPGYVELKTGGCVYPIQHRCATHEDCLAYPELGLACWKGPNWATLGEFDIHPHDLWKVPEEYQRQARVLSAMVPGAVWIRGVYDQMGFLLT